MALQSDQANISVITARIIELVLGMSLEERRVLLKEIEDRQGQGKRQFPRALFFSDVDFATRNRVCKGFIQNISLNGVFIETRESFSVGQQITLAFNLPSGQDHIKIKGEVVRILSPGIGVKFNATINHSRIKAP
jgi:hypothetical protein